MTAIAIRREEPKARFGWVALGIAAALVASLASFGGRLTVASAEPTGVPAPKEAAALIQATSGEASVAMRAVGDDAKLINASLPFNAGPIRAAAPFDLTGGETDHRRALLCLTQAVYYEAGFEPIEGRRAVAQVVLNRMRHPAFPKSVCGVVYQGSRSPVCQFSFVCDGSLYRAPAAGAWQQAREIAAAALGGYVAKSVGSATHYHADYVAPRWAPMLAKINKIGAHIFYRWPGSWGLPGAFTGRYIGEPQDPMALRPALRSTADLIDDVLPIDAPVTGPISDGTVLKRAPNDVGGLLDTSKGWTLNIPTPDESRAATAAVSTSQKGAPVTAAASPSAPVTIASR